MPTDAATDLAGMLAAHGLEAERPTAAARPSICAREAADLEMIFVDMNILVPDVRQVVYELRISQPRARFRSRSWPPMAGSKRPSESPANTSA